LPPILLQFLPSRHSFSRGLFRPFRNEGARGLALFPTIADAQVRTMLRSFALAMAARAVRRCDRFPTAFRKPPPALPDAGSGSTACAAGRSVQPTWASLLIFLRSCQRAMENRFFGITLQPISLRRDAIGFRSAGSIAPCGYASSPQPMLFAFPSRLCRSAKPFPDRQISTRFALTKARRASNS
jgi:hypothetical protein